MGLYNAPINVSFEIKGVYFRFFNNGIACERKIRIARFLLIFYSEDEGPILLLTAQNVRNIAGNCCWLQATHIGGNINERKRLSFMNDKSKDEKDDHPDRPLECSECKKPISVHYTEIVDDNYGCIGMCSDCPQLRRRLQGASYEDELRFIEGRETGLVCGECGTTLDRVRVGHTVGCSHCYDVFVDVLVEEMVALHTISPSFTKKPQSIPLHIGRSPGEKQGVSPSLQLIALNEALEETVKREDYEQAAWLRDQIKELTGESEDANEKE